MSADSKQNRIALVSLYNHRNHAVHMFHSLFEDNGFDVRSYYLRRQYELGRADAREVGFLADQIAQHSPALLCISLMSTYFKLAAEVTQAVRARISTTVLWGGIHPTILPEECLRFADAVCLGDGEDAILEMACAIRSGVPYERISNLWVRRGDAIVRNEPRMLRTDLDSLPLPRFLDPGRVFLGKDSLVDYERGRQLVTSYDIMTSRGCPYSCSYCGNNFLTRFVKGKGPIVRRRSVDNVIAELREAVQLFPNLRVVLVGDDVFSYDTEWLRQFSAKYPDRVGVPFLCNLHANHVDEERMKLLKAAGLRFCVMGIQSGSPSCREQIFHRYTKQGDIIRASELIHDYGIRPLYQFIIDNPLENDAQRDETRVLISQLRKPFMIQLFRLTWFPGTEITRRALEEKVITPGDVEHEKESCYTLMADALSYLRTPHELYWDCSYYLASRFPRALVDWLVHRPFYRRHICTIRWLLRRLPLEYHRYYVLMVNTILNMMPYRAYFYLDALRDRKFRYLRRLFSSIVPRDHPPIF